MSMAFTEQEKSDAYLFFALALNAAPGAVHGAEIARAYQSGATTIDIVSILTGKLAFTQLYPDSQTSEQFAQALVDQVAVASTSQAVRLAAVADIEKALSAGLSKAQVIVQIMTNLQGKSTSDANWGSAISILGQKIALARDLTEGPNAIVATDWASLSAPLRQVTEITPPPAPASQPIEVIAGGTYTGTPGIADHFRSTIANLNGSTIEGNAGDRDTLTLTTAGALTINDGTTGGSISDIKVLNLANGTNTITYDSSAGFTNINGGSGDDTLIVDSALQPITINGGVGVDTIVLSAAYAATASGNNVFASNVTDFEKLTLTSVSNQSIDLRALGNYNDVTVSQGSNNLTLLNLTSNGNLALTGPGTALTISNADFATGMDDIINLSLNDASASRVDFASAGITASEVERVNILNNDNQALPTGLFNNTLTWLGDSAKTINVSGNAGFHLKAASTALTTLDASGITLGGFNWVAGVLADRATIKGSATGTNDVKMNAATAGVDYTGGTGKDDVTINASVASTADLGDGNDILSLNGTTILGTYAGGSGIDSLSLLSASVDITGASITSFEDLTVATKAEITVNADQLAQFTGTINAAGEETINLKTAGTFSALNNIEIYNLADGTNDFTATNSTTNVTGGAGNDTFNFTADQVAKLHIKLDGGSGVDILNISATSTQTIDLSGGKVSGVETINVAGSTSLTTFTNADDAGVTLNYTKSTGGNTIILGSGGQTLNLLGSGSATLIATGANMSNRTQIDSVGNFNVTGVDYFQTGVNATGSVKSFSIGYADTSNYLAEIDSIFDNQLNNAGQAYLFNINAGTAVGTYLFQNTGADFNKFDSTDFFVKLTGIIGPISSDNLIA